MLTEIKNSLFPTELRWFLGIALRIPTAHDVATLANLVPKFLSLPREDPGKEVGQVYNVRDFPQAKLDSEMNARFFLNTHRKKIFVIALN